MPEQYLDLLGKNFLIPITFFAIGAWVVRFFTSLHDSRRRDRIEFLESWRNHTEMSDLEIEVTIRHLFGAYLPAAVIRRVNSMPFPSQTLLRLIEVWPFAKFDSASNQLTWKEGCSTRTSRWKHIAGWSLGYFAFAALATNCYSLMIGIGPEKLGSWLAAALGFIFAGAALWSISRSMDLFTTGIFGDDLMARINDCFKLEHSLLRLE